MSAPDRASVPSAEPGGRLHPPEHQADATVVGRELEPAARQDGGTIEIDARIVAEGLGIAPEDVEPGRQAGSITTLCERGTGEDAGLMRVTFYRGKRRLRLLVDERGTVLEQQPGPAQPNT